MQRYSVLMDHDRMTGAARRESESAPPGFDRLRRGTWWSTVGLVSAAGLFVVVSVLATEPFGAVTVVVAAGTILATLAAARALILRLLSMREGREHEVPVGLVVMAGAGAAVGGGRGAVDPERFRGLGGRARHRGRRDRSTG